MWLYPVAVALTYLLSVVAQAADLETGRSIIREQCGRCHAYDPSAPWNSIGNSPSFMLMAKKLDAYEARIMSVTDRRPHIPLNLRLTSDDLASIVLYVRTLKQE